MWPFVSENTQYILDAVRFGVGKYTLACHSLINSLVIVRKHLPEGYKNRPHLVNFKPNAWLVHNCFLSHLLLLFWCEHENIHSKG